MSLATSYAVTSKELVLVRVAEEDMKAECVGTERLEVGGKEGTIALLFEEEVGESRCWSRRSYSRDTKRTSMKMIEKPTIDICGKNPMESTAPFKSSHQN